MAYKQWDKFHFGCIIHTIIPVQNVAYKIIFYTIDAFQIWNDKLAHPMGLVEKILAILLIIFFKKCGYDKCHSETDFKTFLS